MTYLVDTDRVAEYLMGRESALSLISSLLQARARVAISLITYGEIYEGITFGRNPRQAEQGFRGFLRAVDVLPMNRTIMRRFAQIRGELRQRGVPIGDADTLIAATALHYDLILLTGNIGHFQRVVGLRLNLTTGV